MEQVEPRWLDPASDVFCWVDLAQPSGDEIRILIDQFRFHPLSVDDARSALQYPKIEPYPGYLYLVLHGVDIAADERRVITRDVDFFLGRNYLVTVHADKTRAVETLRQLCERNERVLAEGPVSLMHRIIDAMVDNYRPVIEEVEDRIAALEEQAFTGHEHLVRQMLLLKQELASLRRVLVPQRDAIGRLARREFPAISDEMAFRFRDVYDHVVRLTEEAILYQDRVTGIFELNLTSVSNRLNQVIKVLTVLSTILLPMTVITGLWGMNIPLPHFPGGDAAQFWWVLGLMTAVAAGLLIAFRLKRWI
jgi:magnesium transporter